VRRHRRRQRQARARGGAQQPHVRHHNLPGAASGIAARAPQQQPEEPRATPPPRRRRPPGSHAQPLWRQVAPRLPGRLRPNHGSFPSARRPWYPNLTFGRRSEIDALWYGGDHFDSLGAYFPLSPSYHTPPRAPHSGAGAYSGAAAAAEAAGSYGGFGSSLFDASAALSPRRLGVSRDVTRRAGGRRRASSARRPPTPSRGATAAFRTFGSSTSRARTASCDGSSTARAAQHEPAHAHAS